MILVCNDKGGVGKSTIVPELAVYLFDLGNSVAVIDADRSMASAKHVHGAEPKIPIGALLEKDEILEGVPKLLDAHEFIIADAPANLGQETLALMTLSDVVIIPTETSLKVLEATQMTYALLQECQASTGGKPEHVHVVFNKVDRRRMKKYKSYRKQAIESGLPVTKSYIRLLGGLADVEEQNTTVSRMKSSPKTREALADLTAAFAEIFQSLMVKQQKGKVVNG